MVLLSVVTGKQEQRWLNPLYQGEWSTGKHKLSTELENEKAKA